MNRGWEAYKRTIARWQTRAGTQCRRVHEHLVQAGRVELGQVQADELRVRIVGECSGWRRRLPSRAGCGSAAP